MAMQASGVNLFELGTTWCAEIVIFGFLCGLISELDRAIHFEVLEININLISKIFFI